MLTGIDHKIPDFKPNVYKGIPLNGRKKEEIKGIAILGSHPETVQKAPFHDEGWLIFACSPHNLEQRTLPRVDLWSEVHKPVQHPTRSFRYLDALKQQPFPVVMRDIENMVSFPNAELYPEWELEEEFGPFFKSSSIALMMALAILECEKNGYPAIGLWGIMQASNEEYLYQRPGIQQFIFEAVKRGIDVYAPRASNLFEVSPERW